MWVDGRCWFPLILPTDLLNSFLLILNVKWLPVPLFTPFPLRLFSLHAITPIWFATYTKLLTSHPKIPSTTHHVLNTSRRNNCCHCSLHHSQAHIYEQLLLLLLPPVGRTLIRRPWAEKANWLVRTRQILKCLSLPPTHTIMPDRTPPCQNLTNFKMSLTSSCTHHHTWPHSTLHYIHAHLTPIIILFIEPTMWEFILQEFILQEVVLQGISYWKNYIKMYKCKYIYIYIYIYIKGKNC